VDCASSGAEALDLSAVKDYDMVLSDLDMPGMSGLDLFRALRAKAGKARLVMMSGSRDDLANLGLGVADLVLRKPFQVAELRKILA
jgi:DNA-binding response OmpR family regulator